MNIVVILAVQWGYPGDAVAHWFEINPYNHSGKRLIKIIGHNNFKVTNACSDIVYRANVQGTPDPYWLRKNLTALQPDLCIVCGKVANDTFKRNMVGKRTRIIKLPHPAARTWTKADIERARRKVSKAASQ